MSKRYYNVNSVLALSGGKLLISYVRDVDISTGLYSNLIITGSYNQVWSWGYNVWGQLGDNSTTSKSSPVSIINNMLNISSNGFSLSIDKNGQVWSWGQNNKGQLGLNDNVDRSTPVMIPYI